MKKYVIGNFLALSCAILATSCSNILLFQPKMDAKLWAWGYYLDSPKNFNANFLFKSIGTSSVAVRSAKITPKNSLGQSLPFYMLFDGTDSIYGLFLGQGEGVSPNLAVYTTASSGNTSPEYYMIEIVYEDAEHHSRKIAAKSQPIDGISRFE
ncbi:MAG: hypothetical protein WC784_06555 [Candidatus Shapirobacteria bacterium]|jgi:hypothetical protein